MDINVPNVTENANWPLFGKNRFNIRLETVDALTFRAELDASGEFDWKAK